MLDVPDFIFICGIKLAACEDDRAPNRKAGPRRDVEREEKGQKNHISLLETAVV